jgi:hypothetical protein
MSASCFANRSFAAAFLVLATIAAQPAAALTLPAFVGTTNPADLPASSRVITFSEIPAAVTPFTIKGATFNGPGIILASSFAGAPSGQPELVTQSNPADKMEIEFPTPVSSVGAFLLVAGALTARADVHLELYDDNVLLADLAMGDYTSADQSFFGAYSNGPTFNRAIYRNVANNRVSFAMDDVRFAVPEPSSVSLVVCIGVCVLHTRTRRSCAQRCP